MYRIFDKETKKDVSEDYFKDHTGEVYKLDYSGLCGVTVSATNQDNYIVQQCTGRKDKNGVLIYEGDKVYYNGAIYEVIWDKYMFNLKDFYASYQDTPSDAFSELGYIEIIGNIMEDNNDTT